MSMHNKSVLIYFHPEAYTTSGKKLMGRNAAGESFLKALIKYAKQEEFFIQAESFKHAEIFVALTNEISSIKKPIKVVYPENISALSLVGAVYFPGPSIGKYALQRSFFGHASWSLCGITHTTSSANAMDAISSLLTSPVQTWDALICTSLAVRGNTMRILQAQADFLSQRLGAQRFILPQMPIIPLGIHTDDFVFDESQRKKAREAVGADDDTMVVLYMGRLSFHAKAHPLAMYQALQNAYERSKKKQKIILIECGWHANEPIEKAYEIAAQIASPDIKVITIDGRDSDKREIAWAGADIFCSLSDNIQETFGITPIEAMAAGLPVIVSDWDGYKDTVRDGIDGYRIPTIMPQEGLGGDLALRHALEIDSYDMYCGYSCSFVSVDVRFATEAFIRLFNSKELRLQMGANGRQRALEVYEWRNIIPQYEALWSELSDIRIKDGANLTAQPTPWPARMDPYTAFASYPTAVLTTDTKLELVGSTAAAMDKAVKYLSLAMVDFAKPMLPTVEEIEKIIHAFNDGAPKKAIETISFAEPQRQAFLFRGLNWLCKMDILRVCY